MKRISISIAVLLFLFSCLSLTPDTKLPKTVTKTIWVAGVCGLCEETIEKAMDTKGIISADYVLESNTLTVTFKPHKISEKQIHNLLNEAGYDTDTQKCTEEQYLRTHDCCRYRELEKH